MQAVEYMKSAREESVDQKEKEESIKPKPEENQHLMEKEGRQGEKKKTELQPMRAEKEQKT